MMSTNSPELQKFYLRVNLPDGNILWGEPEYGDPRSKANEIAQIISNGALSVTVCHGGDFTIIPNFIAQKSVFTLRILGADGIQENLIHDPGAEQST